MKQKFALVTDLGGTFLKSALVAGNGKIIHYDTLPTESKKGPKHVIKRLIWQQKDILKKNNIKSEILSGIAVGCPGPLDPEKGIVFTAPNLPGWHNVHLKKILSKAWKKQVYIENDANAASLGEYWLGAGKKAKSLVCLTLGTGVGGGIIIDGKIWHGSTGMAGEIGHITIERNGIKCNCGNLGCLERYVGRKAIEKNWVNATGKKNSPKEIGNLARSGNKTAAKIIEDLGRKIGIVTADIANFFNPEIIVIGGGIAGLGTKLFKTIQNETIKRAFPVATEKLRIVPAMLGENAGLIGLAKLIFNNSLNH